MKHPRYLDTNLLPKEILENLTPTFPKDKLKEEVLKNKFSLKENYKPIGDIQLSSKKQEKSDFRFTDSTNPITIDLLIGKQRMEKVECFVDTGAEHSFCTFSLYERLKEEFTLSSKKCIMESFNGSTEIESIGRIDMSYCTQLKAWKTCVIGIAP